MADAFMQEIAIQYEAQCLKPTTRAESVIRQRILVIAEAWSFCIAMYTSLPECRAWLSLVAVACELLQCVCQVNIVLKP